MPELPEVETVVRDLRPAVVGRRVAAVRHGAKRLRMPWDPAWNDAVTGAKVVGVRRRGKWIVFELRSTTPPPLPPGEGEGKGVGRDRGKGLTPTPASSSTSG